MSFERLLFNPIVVLIISAIFLLTSSLADFSVQLASATASGETSEISGNNSPDDVTAAVSQALTVTRTATATSQNARNALRSLKFASEGSESTSSGVSGTPVAGGMSFRGQAAGDGFGYPWGVWASYQRIDFEDDFTATAFDGDTDLVLIGADLSPWDNFVAGVALGYESSNIDTFFNAGNQSIDGYTVMPYLGALLSENLGVDFDLSVDFSIGFSSLDIDQFRTAGGTRVTSSTDTDRVLFSGNVNASQQFGNLNIGARTGLLFARDEQDGFTESDGTINAARRIELGRFSIGGEARYLWGTFEPFVGATYELDYEQEELVTATAPQPANDDDDVLFGTGINWYPTDNFTAGFRYEAVLGRENFDSDTYSFIIRAEF